LRDSPGQESNGKPTKKRGQVVGGLVLFVVILWILVTCLGPSKNEPATTTIQTPKAVLTSDQRAVVLAALAGVGVKEGSITKLGIDDTGYLGVTIELADPISASYLKSYATNALLAVRNAMYQRGVVDSYSVTLNGPSPGPGLVSRYGRALFNEGGSVNWEPAVKP
jgi:hypothetical protein